jgi:ATP-binding cassette subfamily C protein CydC
MATSARLLRLLEDADAARTRTRRVSALSIGLSTAVTGAALLAVLGLGLLAFGGQVRTGAPTVAMLVLITVGIFETIEALPLAYQQAGVVRRAAQRLNHLFRAPVDAAAPTRYVAFPERASVALRDVAFSYCGASDERNHDERDHDERDHDASVGESQRVVVAHLHMTIQPGTLVALVGRSGAGKTTVLKLLAGELEPTAGAITLGGSAIDSISRTEFWRHVGYVAQDSHIFSGSIRDNVLLADPDADDAALFDALQAVGLADVVGSMDDGLDTAIGEAGDRLSGGQRRRLCVARALLRNPDILLLDEPTAGVDAATARRMLTAIRLRLPHSSIIVATHDPLPAAMADVVVTVGAAG